MQSCRTILILFALLLLVNLTTALELSNSTITDRSATWITANGVDSSTISVSVFKDSEKTPVQGATVLFGLEDPSLGSISPVSVTTGADGIASTVFTALTKSGTANVTAEITYTGDPTTPLVLFTNQPVDHDTAQTATYAYLPAVPVGTVTPLTITLTDRSAIKNPVDSRNPAETHAVHLTMGTGGGSGLWDSRTGTFVSELDIPTDLNGRVTADLRVSTVSGTNLIQMDPIGSIVDPQIISIEGFANSSVPCTITQIAPVPAAWPADGAADHYFNLYYTVKDSYGNPVEGTNLTLQSLGKNTGVSETALTSTYTGGTAFLTYGPKYLADVYTITARSDSNASIICTNTGTVGSCSQDLEFYSENPVDITLSASPQTLVSTDVDPASSAILRARVVDKYGNAVDEYPQGTPVTVTFTPGTVSFPGAPAGGYNQTAPPSLSSQTAVMGSDGYASVVFTPGKFTTDGGSPGYNATATGTCIVTANWTHPSSGKIMKQEISLTWKNYPFLTISSEFDRSIKRVGEYINITIRITGDGAALQPKPIDVVLVNDRSGSMLEGYPDRMVDAKAAGALFRSKLSGNDRIGIVSFGDTSGSSGYGYARLAPSKVGTRWNWSGVNYYWYWVRQDSSSTYSSDCYGCYYGDNSESSSSYSATSNHQVYLNTYYNNGNPKYYGSTNFASEDLAIGFNSQTTVEDALKGIVPAGGTPMREGIYRGVLMLDTPRNPPSATTPVKAIILLSDGEWNTGGDPEGGGGATSFVGPGTGSVITWAKNKGVKIFPIGLGVSSSTEADLRSYAAETGGNYTSASDSSQLSQIYTDIAGALIEEASGATSASVNFGANSISVNGSLIASTEDVGKYVNYSAYPAGGRPVGQGSATDSTFVYKYHTNLDKSVTDYYKYVRDDTQNWTGASKLLQFDVGTMRLNDTWQTSFRLNLTSPGQIVLFPSCGSTVTFVDSGSGKSQTGCIPSSPVLVYAQDETVFGTYSLTVENLRFVEGVNPNPAIWRIAWDTSYDGKTAVLERVTSQSSEPGSVETTLYTPSALYSGVNPQALSWDIDTSGWKSGYTYTIRVHAESYDAQTTYATLTRAKTQDTGKIFIKLE